MEVPPLDRDSLLKNMVITISGLAGSGKSYCASALSRFYGLPCHSAGSIFRQMALERGITIEELTIRAHNDPQIDKEIDCRSEELARGGGVILEGRLVAYFASSSPHRLSFYLTAPFEERSQRIAEREGIPLEEARERTKAREEGEHHRYRSFYGFDTSDLSVYDFVINTSIWGKESELTLLRRIIDTYLENQPQSRA